MVCTFASCYYDMSRWWTEYINGKKQLEIVDTALEELKKNLNKTLSHTVMLPEPLMDLCKNFRDVELLISQAVSHIETFKSGMESPQVQDLVEKLLLPTTDDVSLYSEEDPIVKEMLLSMIGADPDAREYRFRCMAPRPYLFSKHMAQSMYVLYSSNEFRICTALSEQV